MQSPDRNSVAEQLFILLSGGMEPQSLRDFVYKNAQSLVQALRKNADQPDLKTVRKLYALWIGFGLNFDTPLDANGHPVEVGEVSPVSVGVTSLHLLCAAAFRTDSHVYLYLRDEGKADPGVKIGPSNICARDLLTEKTLDQAEVEELVEVKIDVKPAVAGVELSAPEDADPVVPKTEKFWWKSPWFLMPAGLFILAVICPSTNDLGTGFSAAHHWSAGQITTFLVLLSLGVAAGIALKRGAFRDLFAVMTTKSTQQARSAAELNAGKADPFAPGGQNANLELVKGLALGLKDRSAV